MINTASESVATEALKKWHSGRVPREGIWKGACPFPFMESGCNLWRIFLKISVQMCTIWYIFLYKKNIHFKQTSINYLDLTGDQGNRKWTARLFNLNFGRSIWWHQDDQVIESGMEKLTLFPHSLLSLRYRFCGPNGVFIRLDICSIEWGICPIAALNI